MRSLRTISAFELLIEPPNTGLEWETDIAELPFFGIFDVSLSANSASPKDLHHSLDGLPSQQSNTCRFYVYQEPSREFIAHLDTLGLGSILDDDIDPLVSSWGPLNSHLQDGQTTQWHTNIHTFGYSVGFVDMVGRLDQKFGESIKKFVRSGYGGIALDAILPRLLATMPGLLQLMPPLLQGLYRHQLSIRCMWHTDGRMFCKYRQYD